MNQPSQYATGQMAGIMRVQPAWTPWPEQVSEYWGSNGPPWRTLRAVPMTRRSTWKPWPWRTWGYPPGRMAYRPFWPDRLPTYWYGWWMPEAPQSMGWGGAAWPATTSYGRAFLPGGFHSDIVAGEVPAALLTLNEATRHLLRALQAASEHGEPTRWSRGHGQSHRLWTPTADFQRAFNAEWVPRYGLFAGKSRLTIDGVFGDETRSALHEVVSGPYRTYVPGPGDPDLLRDPSGQVFVGQMLYGPASQNYHPLPVGVDPLQGPRAVPPPFNPLEGPVPRTYG